MLCAVPVIPRIIGTEVVKTVSARDLHKALGVGTLVGGRHPYHIWVCEHLVLGFFETEDYEALPAKERSPNDYALTLRCAAALTLKPRTVFSEPVREYLLSHMGDL